MGLFASALTPSAGQHPARGCALSSLPSSHHFSAPASSHHFGGSTYRGHKTPVHLEGVRPAPITWWARRPPLSQRLPYGGLAEQRSSLSLIPFFFFNTIIAHKSGQLLQVLGGHIDQKGYSHRPTPGGHTTPAQPSPTRWTCCATALTNCAGLARLGLVHT